MGETFIDVKVAFAEPDKQVAIDVRLVKGNSVLQAINASGILEQYPEIDLEKLRVGIFSKVCELEKVVEQGDRVEIYRPLLQNPMDARRNRAVRK